MHTKYGLREHKLQVFEKVHGKTWI